RDSSGEPVSPLVEVFLKHITTTTFSLTGVLAHEPSFMRSSPTAKGVAAPADIFWHSRIGPEYRHEDFTADASVAKSNIHRSARAHSARAAAAMDSTSSGSS